ncbi:MAG: T9SS type A sorting domain-containing protein [Bacteroidota bacterium]
MKQAFVFVALCVPSFVLACTCPVLLSPTAARDSAAAVFAGTVTEGGIVGQQLRVQIKVSGVWKATDSTAVERTVTVVTAGNEARCGFPFQPRQGYLVYADTTGGVFTTGLCTRTRRFDQAAEDLAALGDPIGVDTEGETPATFGLEVFPNPATGAVRARLSLGRAGPVRWQLFDAAGRLVRSWRGERPAGPSEQRIDLAGLPPGRYALQVQAGERRRAEWIVVR